MNERTKRETIETLISNPKSNIAYRRGIFLGKGGFARCYEFINIKTGEILAGKVISKTGLIQSYQMRKIMREILIHRSLSHRYIVSLHSFFEDESNIYIMMELCCKQSLMEMHKRRKSLTLPEVRYIMRQLALACKYLHDCKIIHRDLKLGNVFINDDMEIRVGDFGFATWILNQEDKRKSMCGTPNYIAPEILANRGYGYEVDFWSLGCIMYTMLVGSPPFETETLKSTFSKIKKCEYYLPPTLDYNARQLIKKLLHPDPTMRPNAETILMDNFLTSEPIPLRLPKTCLFFSSCMSLCKMPTNSSLKGRFGNIPANTPKKAVAEAKA